jgi:hypothetical protein
MTSSRLGDDFAKPKKKDGGEFNDSTQKNPRTQKKEHRSPKNWQQHVQGLVFTGLPHACLCVLQRGTSRPIAWYATVYCRCTKQLRREGRTACMQEEKQDPLRLWEGCRHARITSSTVARTVVTGTHNSFLARRTGSSAFNISAFFWSRRIS